MHGCGSHVSTAKKASSQRQSLKRALRFSHEQINFQFSKCIFLRSGVINFSRDEGYCCKTSPFNSLSFNEVSHSPPNLHLKQQQHPEVFPTHYAPRNAAQFPVYTYPTSSPHPTEILQRLLHLRDVQLDVRVHLQKLVMCSVYLVLDVLLQIHHLCNS